MKGSESSQQVLRTLVTTVQALAELRNEIGIGHGQSNRSVALTRHARLALKATVTVAEFVPDTWESRVCTGRLKLRISVCAGMLTGPISRDSLVRFGARGVHWSVVADQNRG